MYAPVAQMDRVLVSEAKGRGFDSRRARHIRLSGVIKYDSRTIRERLKDSVLLEGVHYISNSL